MVGPSRKHLYLLRMGHFGEVGAKFVKRTEVRQQSRAQQPRMQAEKEERENLDTRHGGLEGWF